MTRQKDGKNLNTQERRNDHDEQNVSLQGDAIAQEREIKRERKEMTCSTITCYAKQPHGAVCRPKTMTDFPSANIRL